MNNYLKLSEAVERLIQKGGKMREIGKHGCGPWWKIRGHRFEDAAGISMILTAAHFMVLWEVEDNVS